MRKRYISYIATISILSLVYINNTSALDYSSNVGIGFTFNPTLSVSLSSSDLIIPNLVPGSTLDSNSINVSVATNAAYGYTLSVNVGDDIHNNTNLTHSNNTNVFSSIAMDTDLASLEDSDDSNIWGYSYKNNIASIPTWSNYSGLSNSVNKVLFNTDSNTSGSIDFKIAAKASNTQPSGEYTGTINFIAITKPTPMNLAESYFAHGKTRHNGYYAMQDMTTEICNDTEIIGEGSQTELIDIRDNKVYWVTKLVDNHCWMTQNLDLDLDSNRTYTHWDTDLGWTVMDEEAGWKPERSTIDFSGTTVDGWVNNYTRPYSANPGDVYYYTSNSDADDIKYDSLQECISAGHNGCTHYHAGNYYNWSAAVASNDTNEIMSGDAPGSICAKGWEMPTYTTDSTFGNLLYLQGISTSPTSNVYAVYGFILARKSPVYLIRAGGIWDGHITLQWGGLYISSTIASGGGVYAGILQLSLDDNYFKIRDNSNRTRGLSIRCLAR